MLYLLDANTLIDAKRDYFQFDRVPEFWSWLQHQGKLGNIKIPSEIYEEFEEARRNDGTRDDLSTWASSLEVREALVLEEEVDIDMLRFVVKNGYCDNPSDEDVQRMGKDPFLISYALRFPGLRQVVTTEASRPSAIGANRKVPDVCKEFGITSVNNFQLISLLDFRTSWREG
jgi:hypothetical protein